MTLRSIRTPHKYMPLESLRSLCAGRGGIKVRSLGYREPEGTGEETGGIEEGPGRGPDPSLKPPPLPPGSEPGGRFGGRRHTLSRGVLTDTSLEGIYQRSSGFAK